MLSLLIHGVKYILMICKTKIDDSFPMEQFIIQGYCTICRLNRNDRVGGVMLIVKENLLNSCLNKCCFPIEIEIFCIEINLQKKKWLFFCYYNPHKHLLKNHLFQIDSVVNRHSNTYEKLIIIGDFNVEISDLKMESFCTKNNPKCIINEPTFNKNPDNLTSASNLRLGFWRYFFFWVVLWLHTQFLPPSFPFIFEEELKLI